MDQKTEQVDKPVRRRWKRGALIALGVLLLLLVGGIVRLLSGPIHVGSLANTLIERSGTPLSDVYIEDTSLDFSDIGKIKVVLTNARLELDGQTKVSVAVPEVELPLDLLALLSGEVKVSSLSLSEPAVIMTLGGETGAVPAFSTMMEAAETVAGAIDDALLEKGLDTVQVTGAHVEVIGSTPRSIDGINAIAWRTDAGRLELSATLEGKRGDWRFQYFREGATLEQPGRQVFLANDVTLSDILPTPEKYRVGKGLALPIGVRLESRFALDGTFQSANLVGRMTDGWFRQGRTLVRFDDAALSLAWSGDNPDIEITRSHVIRGNTRIFFTGEMKAPKQAGDDWLWNIKTDYAQVGSADIPISPIGIDLFNAQGRFSGAEQTVFFDRVEMRVGEAVSQAVGSLQITEQGPYLALAVEGEKFPVGLTKQIWPITLVPPARKWVIEHMKGGVIDRFAYQGAIQPPAFDITDPDPGWSGNDVTFDMAFTGVGVEPLGEIPLIEGLTGTLTVADETLTVDATSGVMKASDGTVIDVPESRFVIQHLTERDGKLGVLDADLEGPALQMAEVFNSKPLLIMDKAKITPSTLSGSAKAAVHASFPLVKKLKLQDVAWTANIEAKDFASSEPIQGHTLERADVKVDANPSRVAVTGTGRLDGLDANIDLVIPLGDSTVAGRQGVTVDVSVAQLSERGVDLSEFLRGTMQVGVSDKDGQRHFDVDLRNAEVLLNALGWSKSRGVPASATFKLKTSGNQTLIEDFQLESEGTNIFGAIVLSSKGDLQTAQFSRFQLRAGDQASMRIDSSGSGNYRVSLEGKSFDARGLINQFKDTSPKSGGSKPYGSLRVFANLDSVQGFGGLQMANTSVALTMSGSEVTQATVTGQLSGNAAVNFTIEPNGNGRLARGEFGNTGRLLKFLDLYRRMQNGSGTLVVNMASAKSWTGAFNVRRLSITEDPAIARLKRRQQQNVGSGGALVRQTQSDGTSGGADFETLSLDFNRYDDVINITRGALEGAAFGGTVEGLVDLNSSSLDLNGTFVPIYALNNLFAKIPILGFALGGGNSEGLFGVTYRVTGAISDPILTVNPISAIAPGIFRKMFQ